MVKVSIQTIFIFFNKKRLFYSLLLKNLLLLFHTYESHICKNLFITYFLILIIM